MIARMRERVRDRVPDTNQPPPRPPAWKKAAIGLVAVVVLVQFVRLIYRPKGDFDVHWESGRRMAVGEPLYAHTDGQDERGHNYPYPPFWALAHAPFSWLPILPAQLLLYPLIVVAGYGLVKTLHRLSRTHEPLPPDRQFLVTAGAVFLTSRFLVRDMPECGVNLALVALSWLAVECWVRRRDWAGGWCLGLAISLKCTPALFLAWFLWKRQWKFATATIVAMAVFSLSPMLVMGPKPFWDTMAQWTGHVWRGVGETHPAYGVLGDEPLQNVSLRPALARYLTVLPEGHRSRVDHPLYFDVFTFSPEVAGWIIKAVLLGLVAGVAWWFRRPVVHRDDPQWLWEAAAVSVLLLLLSPITWGQHCVGVLPAFYLMMRKTVAGKYLPAWTKAVVWAYIAGMLLLNREVIGKDLTYLLDSYRLPTLFLLALLAVALRLGTLDAEENEAPAAEARSVQGKSSRAAKPAELAAIR